MTENRENNNTPEREEASSEETEGRVEEMNNGELLEKHENDKGKRTEIETQVGEKTLGEYKEVVEEHNELQREIDQAKKEKEEKENLQALYNEAEKKIPGEKGAAGVFSELEKMTNDLQKPPMDTEKKKKGHVWKGVEVKKLLEKAKEMVDDREKKEEGGKEKLKKEKERLKKTKFHLDILGRNETLVDAFSVMSAREELGIKEESEDFEELKRKLGEDVLKKVKELKDKEKKLSEQIEKEKGKSTENLSSEERGEWGEKIDKMERRVEKIKREMGREKVLPLLEWDYLIEKAESRREVIDKFKEEGAQYEQMRDEKGKFSGKEFRATKDQVEKAKREMKKEQRGRNIKKGFFGFFFSLKEALSSLGWFAWDAISKGWAKWEEKKEKKE